MNEFDVIESASLTQDSADATGKKWRTQIIKAGWGSKGYYPSEVLEKDGPVVFKAGTPIFIDHPTPEEREVYAFGKVGNLVGELATDAVWNAEESALECDVEIYDHRVDLVKAVAKKVGLSIRATTKWQRGEAEGRMGRIITGLVGAKSVDLVVRAGAGGKFLDVLESESEEEMEEQMSQEILDAIKQLSDNVDARFHDVEKKFAEVEESLAAATAVVEPVEAPAETEANAEDDKQVDIEKTVAELVAAELAKIAPVQESADTEGNEEDAEVEESATELKLPKYWVVKGEK